jgi:hypothetical protein
LKPSPTTKGISGSDKLYVDCHVAASSVLLVDRTALYRHPMLRKHSIYPGGDMVKQWRVLGCEALAPGLEARHDHGYTAVA